MIFLRFLITVFKTRRKYQPRRIHEKLFLKSKIEQDNTRISELWQAYSLSRSMHYSIKANNRIDSRDTDDINKRAIFREETNKIIERIISNYINEERWAFTLKDIQFKLNAEHFINISKSNIRKLMKKRLNHSFKRVSSRPSNILLENKNFKDFYF